MWSCNHCIMTVTKALNEIDGIKNVKVDLSKGEASFNEVKPVDIEIVTECIKKAGYQVGTHKSEVKVELKWLGIFGTNRKNFFRT